MGRHPSVEQVVEHLCIDSLRQAAHCEVIRGDLVRDVSFRAASSPPSARRCMHRRAERSPYMSRPEPASRKTRFLRLSTARSSKTSCNRSRRRSRNRKWTSSGSASSQSSRRSKSVKAQISPTSLSLRPRREMRRAEEGNERGVIPVIDYEKRKTTCVMLNSPLTTAVADADLFDERLTFELRAQELSRKPAKAVGR